MIRIADDVGRRNNISEVGRVCGSSAADKEGGTGRERFPSREDGTITLKKHKAIDKNKNYNYSDGIVLCFIRKPPPSPFVYSVSTE